MLRLVALLLLAGLVSAVRPDVQERLGGEIQYVCEGYTAEQVGCAACRHCLAGARPLLLNSSKACASLSKLTVQSVAARYFLPAISISSPTTPTHPPARPAPNIFATCLQCKDLKLAHCRLCTRVDGLALCFDPQVSAQLSPHVFKCMDPSAAASAAAAAAGTVQCEKLSPEECKEHASECALCASPLKPAKCYQPEEARKLPARECVHASVGDGLIWAQLAAL